MRYRRLIEGSRARRDSRRRPAAVLVLLLAAVVLGACARPDPGPTVALEEATPTFVREPRDLEGPPRAFRLGFSAVPAELTDEAYREAFDLAANWGEVLLLPRTPAWGDFLPEVAQPSQATEDAVVAQREALRARALEAFVALDPFDPMDRSHVQGLPESHAGRDLTDPDLRQAFIAEAVFVARNLRPAYLSLGTEVNATYERDPAAYAAFVTLYAEAYDAVKEAAPDVAVFATFQYEELRGVVPWLPSHAPRWELLRDFGHRLDLFAITTYPSFAYAQARKIPAGYYLEIREHTDLPVAFASVGFASGEGRHGLNSSLPAEQRRFLQRMFEDAETLESPLVVWFAGRDLTFAQEPPYDLLRTLGLRDEDDTPKEAWLTWATEARRPYDPEAAGSRDGASGGG